ncbi:MAG: F0F1 ATP synthase subunit epsilon, partial [Actinomycetia bacterium]|nr:F0F1 ATP synthase subunit epsilon [Actinomycetes bacterium]
MAELQVAIVSVDRSVWSGAAKNVVLKTVEGDMGILPGHEPVLAMLSDGPVRIDPVDEDPRLFAVHGGFFSLDGNRIQILAEIAEAAEDIDLQRAKAAKERI